MIDASTRKLLSDGLFLCPRCEAAVLAPRDAEAGAICKGCRSEFSMANDVLDLLPGVSNSYRGLRFLMESWFVHFHDGVLFRQNPLFQLMAGLDFSGEVELTLAGADPHENDLVLDVASGCGNFTRVLAEAASQGTAVGLDIAYASLELGKRRQLRDGVRNAVAVHGTALALPFVPERFAAVNCTGSLHIFPDKMKALREIHRVLKPGGRFVFGTFRRPQARIWRVGAAMTRALFGLDPATSGEWEQRLAGAGFGDIKILHDRRLWLVMSARKP